MRPARRPCRNPPHAAANGRPTPQTGDFRATIAAAAERGPSARAAAPCAARRPPRSCVRNHDDPRRAVFVRGARRRGRTRDAAEEKSW
ncbi:hypothetical protein C6P78_00205 [Burkholderia multivorans]|nr:hypothetical protein C6P78_00205 [Burkholderia multivorans]